MLPMYYVQAQMSKPKLSLSVELLTTASFQTAPTLTSWVLLCILPSSSHFFSLYVSFTLLEFNYLLPFCKRKTGHSTPKQLHLAGQEDKQNKCHWYAPLCLSFSNSSAPCERNTFAVADQPDTCSLWDGDLDWVWGTGRDGCTCCFFWVLEYSALGISFHFLLSHQLNTHWKIKAITVKI